jgi:hypothetical protein
MRTAVFTIRLLLIVSSAGASANLKENPLFDRYGAISFDAEKLRLDNYAIHIKNAPGSRGFIVVYSGGNWTQSYVKWRAKRAVNYLIQKKRITADRIGWRYDAHCRQGSVLLYLFYPNEATPNRDTKCNRAF